MPKDKKILESQMLAVFDPATTRLEAIFKIN